MYYGDLNISARKDKRRSIYLSVLLFYFIWLLVFSGITKLADQSFVNFWLNTPFLFEKSIAEVFAIVIPIVELLTAVLIGLRRTRRIGLYFAVLIFMIYATYSIWSLLNVNGIPCSCTGLIAKFSWKQYLYFNIGNLVLACLSFYILKNDKRFYRDNDRNVS
jgi:uncharacterized membrane protein YphA (DoxX/SURF4 family)